MSMIEQKLLQMWGATAVQFCTTCGAPTGASDCTHTHTAPWAELDERQRTLVRWLAIQTVKSNRLTRTVTTVAS